MNSVDPDMWAAIEAGRLDMLLRKLANALCSNFPVTPNTLVRARNKLKDKEADNWCDLKVQGQGVPCFRNQSSIPAFMTLRCYVLRDTLTY